ncbi:MAG: acyl-CoA synthetase [Actinobacteria bacterium]|nr:acyl-CoA synthetase [Actinomycetota bacterium]
MEWNFADMFEGVADVVTDRTALVCGERRLTYRELDERATRLANHLAANGVEAGDHVGIYAYNGSEWMEAMLGAWKIRAVPINVNYRYVEAELAYLFDNADLVALVHGREFVARIAAVRSDCPKLTTFVSIEDGSAEDLAAIGAVEYEAALADAPAGRDFPPRDPGDLYMLYTGGTTGMPKGVMWRQDDFFFSTVGALMVMGGEMYASPEAVVEAAKGGGGTVGFPIAPLMHGAAQWVALMLLLQGNTVVLTSQRRMDPHAVWATVVREKVMSISLVGDAMARPLIEALDEPGADYDLSGLFVIGSGGAILSPAVKEKIAEKLPNVLVIDSLGASETGYQGAVAGADDEGKPRFAMGDHTTVIDDEGKPVEPGSGVVGHLARSGYMPLGYYKDEAKTAATFVELNGRRWSMPGDMARIEADGTITLLGRGSVSINSGGEKIFPEEVELALKSHPAVFDVVVVGVPDERWGERVVAVVKAREGQQPSVEELATHARERIAGYKVPREVHLVDEIVRSPSGKADYRWAKAQATDGGS